MKIADGFDVAGAVTVTGGASAVVNRGAKILQAATGTTRITRAVKVSAWPCMMKLADSIRSSEVPTCCGSSGILRVKDTSGEELPS